MDVVRFRQLIRLPRECTKMQKLEEILIFQYSPKHAIVAPPLADLLLLSLSNIQTKQWNFLPWLRSKEHLLTMGQKWNNNNCANKHQKLETIPWYLCQKFDMLGRCHGHLIIVFIRMIFQLLLLLLGGGGNFFLYANA